MARNEARLVETSKGIAEYSNQDHRLRSRSRTPNTNRRLHSMLYLVRYGIRAWLMSDNDELWYCFYAMGTKKSRCKHFQVLGFS
jgi:hypothetical protein